MNEKTPTPISNRFINLLPWAGLFLLLTGAALAFMTRRFDLATNLTLAGGALLLLLFAIIRPDDVRRLLSTRQSRYGGSAVLSILFFAAIVVIIYFITYQNSDWRYDATEANEFTPLPETVQLLESLEDPVHIIGFYTLQLALQQEEARAQLESMQAYTNQLTYEFVDPEQNPLAAEPYDLNVNGTLVFTRPDDPAVFAKASLPVDDRSIHTALVQVINPTNKKVYFLTGHGERDTESFDAEGLGTAVQLLQESNFQVETLNLFTAGAVPDDATVLAIVGQQAPLTDEEAAAIAAYLDSGGALLIARDVLDSESSVRADEDGLMTLLQNEWGITFRPDVIIEQVLAQAGQSFGLSFLGANYGASTITGAELEQFGTVFALARSLASEPVEGVNKVNLITTSDQAWGETDFANLSAGAAEPNEGVDEDGPLTIAISAENAETGARLVALGDSDFAGNTYVLQNGNSLLLTNAFNWLADDEVAVSLTPRETVNRQLTVTQSQLGLIQLVVLFLTPGVMAVIGVVVWYTRRQRR